jgi:hypothetical protein
MSRGTSIKANGEMNRCSVRRRALECDVEVTHKYRDLCGMMSYL